MSTRAEHRTPHTNEEDAEVETLKAALQDESLMTRVRAVVDRWPALTTEQRETVAALLNPKRRHR